MSPDPIDGADPWGITVCMATFNGTRFLAEQLASILMQLGPSDELVVVDDASTDDTPELIAALTADAPCPVRIQRNRTNRGHVASFERALGSAGRPIVMLADQDDVWLSGYVDHVRHVFASDPAVGLTVARPIFSTVDLEPIDAANERYRHPRHGGLLGVLLFMANRAMPIGCTMSIRRHDLDYVLPFPPGLLAHDHWLFAMVTIRRRMRPIETPAIRYRRHPGVITVKRPPRHMLQSRLRLLSQLLRYHRKFAR